MANQGTRQLNILVCPLDWGLGHASRMIPVVRRFLRDGHRIYIAGSGRSLQLLEATFPDLIFIRLPSPGIRLGDSPCAHLGMLLQLPGWIISLFREHARVRKIVRHHQIDILISDNRYGLFCKYAYTIFVTHQLSPVLPGWLRWLEYPLYRILRDLIRLFDACWIPDFEDPEHNLSGKLSHRFPRPENARFIGPLSRFDHHKVLRKGSFAVQNDFVVVLSGPEPQITRFEQLVCQQLERLPVSATVIRGMRGELLSASRLQEGRIKLIPHLEEDMLSDILLQAGHVICRSGYSGIMDLLSLGIPAILVPTPGQSEQEYLADHHARKGWFQVIQQKHLNLAQLMNDPEKPELRGFRMDYKHSGTDPYLNLYGEYRDHDKKAHQKA